MINYSITKIKKNWKNKIIVKNISLDHKLDFFILIDSNNKNYAEILESKIFDLVIDKISKEDTYKDFSKVLEKINSLLKTYNKEKKTWEYLNILLSVLSNNYFIFSEIGKPSLYLIKDTGETIEITNKKEDKKEFSFISEWDLDNNDILIIWTTRLLNYLSYSDFNEEAFNRKTDKINKNLEIIFLWEKLDKKIWFISIQYTNENLKNEKKSELIDKIKKIWFKLIDNNFIKLILAYFKILKEKLDKKSKLIKNLLLILWMLIATIVLYTILSWALQTVTNTEKQIVNQQLFEQAIKHKILASHNYSNPEKFNLNIKAAEWILKILQEKKINLNNIQKLKKELNIIKKTFDWIETFSENEKNLIYRIPENLKNEIIETIVVDKKVFLITKNSIIGPIWKNKKPKINTFQNLWDDEFIDVTVLNRSIMLLTERWKVVEFISSWKFFFRDVLWQDLWQRAHSILSFWRNNIYLVNKDTNQIYKHTRSWNNFTSAEANLKKEDSRAIWNILSVAIDWGFYILKNDLSILKFFSNPYRLESIRINNLPNSYKLYDKSSKVKIIARANLSYVYMLLNNKVWIFKPNTRFFRLTQSLRYLWQIEAKNNKIIDFYVEKDWNLIILNKTWIYEISFNESDWRIIVNN